MDVILEFVRGLGVMLHVYLIGMYYSIVECLYDKFLRSDSLSRDSKFFNALRKPVAVVTGGSGTIGKELLNLLLEQGFVVIDISNDRGNIGSQESKRLKKFTVDLTNLEAARILGQQIVDSVDKINLVICNAGVMFAPNKVQISNSHSSSPACIYPYETHIALHLLGHAVLIDALKPALISANGLCRIVFVASSTAFASYLDYYSVHTGDVFKEYINGYYAYAKSKLVECCYAEQLDWFFANECKDKPPIARVCSLHPGCVAGNLYSNSWLPARILINHVFFRLLRRARTAAEEILSTALDDTFVGGCYYERQLPCELLQEHRAGVVTRRELYNQVKLIIKSL